MSGISKFVGIEFKEKGRDFDGLDCWGLVYLIYKKCRRIELPTYTDSYTLADQKEIEELIRNEKSKWQRIRNDFQIYDILLFRIKGRVAHVGVFVGKGKFIHCLENVGVVIESIYSPVWNKRLVGAYRYDS